MTPDDLTFYQISLLQQLSTWTMPWAETTPMEKEAFKGLAELGFVESTPEEGMITRHKITAAGRKWLAQREKDLS